MATTNDVFGRAAAVDDSQAGRTAYSYYADGQLLSVTVFSPNELVDPYRETSYGYDALGRNTSIVDSVAGTTSFSFDHRGRRTSLTDSVDNTTSWTYDQLDQVVTETDPLAAERSFRYDRSGNLVRAVDRLGRTIDYTYDAAGGRTKELWFAPSEAPEIPVALGGDDANAIRTFTYV